MISTNEALTPKACLYLVQTKIYRDWGRVIYFRGTAVSQPIGLMRKPQVCCTLRESSNHSQSLESGQSGIFISTVPDVRTYKSAFCLPPKALYLSAAETERGPLEHKQKGLTGREFRGKTEAVHCQSVCLLNPGHTLVDDRSRLSWPEEGVFRSRLVKIISYSSVM